MDWIKRNKLVVGLVLVILFLLGKEVLFSGFRQMSYSPVGEFLGPAGGLDSALVDMSSKVGGFDIPRSSAPPVQKEDRLVVEESFLSLLIKDVRGTSDKIIDLAKSLGGFMVSSSLSQPEEAPYGTIVIRVPADKFRETLDQLRDMAVKVVSENISGTDVTSEYVDIEARIATLQKTKLKFESIMDQAVEIQDILQVQRELINLQDQIDNLTGQKQYLVQIAKLAKITVHLSTDELALPYAPSKPFRMAVIFKLAVRSLVQALRGMVTVLIWVGVYSIVWLPAGLVVILFRRWKKKRTSGSN